MDMRQLEQAVSTFLLDNPMNRVQPEDAIREDLIGMRMYDAPIFGVADAADPIFADFRGETVVHPDYLLPADWLPGATRVVSFFAPYTARVREANAADMTHCVDEWLHARIEGEMLMKAARLYLCDLLREAGFAAVAPAHDERFAMPARYAPNWSERHTAYACGLGTFGMSKGIITEKGMGGRLGSVVTDCPLPVTPRAYTGVYDNCTECGLCAANCPVDAINPALPLHEAKSHPVCDAFLAQERGRPPRGASGRARYGCGKCQVAVPCETCNPAR